MIYRSGGLQGQGLRPSPYSPWFARALGRSGVSGLVVKALTQNAIDVGSNPTWSQLFPAVMNVSEKLLILYKS